MAERDLALLSYEVKLWSSQLWTQFLRLRREAWKIQDFNGIWTRDLVIPVRRSNQLSYEATDVGSWSFVGSNLPVRNNQRWNDIWIGSYMNCGYEIKWSYDLLLSYKHNNFWFLSVATTSLNTFSRAKQLSSVFFFLKVDCKTSGNSSVASFNTRSLQMRNSICAERNWNDGTKQIDHPSEGWAD